MELGTGAIGSLLPKLVEVLKEEYDLHKGVRKKIKHLSQELESMNAVLLKVGEVPPDQLDELVKLWAGDVRELSYDMEDVVDAFLVHIDGPEPLDTHMLRRFRKKMANFFNKCKHHHKIAGAIQDVNKKVEEVASRRDRYMVDNIIAKVTGPVTIDPRLQALYKKTTELVGIEKQSEKLVKILSLGDDVHASDEKMKIVSIVGFGGLGKTTLSKAVYDKHKLAFDCGAFVPVGRDPDMKKVLRDILIDFDYMNPNVMILDERQLINELRKLIQNKRFLFVIDDIWDKKSWELIRCALQHSNCGGRVVVTTRIFEVATHIGDIYKMQPLSRDDSEILLYSRINDGEDRFLDSLSTEACDKILKKCGGVPLAIITIASLLASKSGEDWSNVYNSIGFGERGNDIVENTRRILSFSYYDLPSHLKACMLYLSLFREEYGIEKNLLIWKWIAECFIQNEHATGIGLFELGEGYFNELINRSMIQPMELEDNGYVYGCRVHDMVLDLVCSLSSEEKFATILDSDDQQKQLMVGSNARRLAVHGRSVEEHNHPQLVNVGLEKVRSFSATQCGDINVVTSYFRVLRVLTLEDCSVTGEACGKHRLEHVGNLRHLRYLGIWNTRIDEFPKEVGDLKFLQTLNLSGTGIQQLPEAVGLLKQLLCLRINDSIAVPAGLIGNLTSLQELKIWPVDDVSTRQFVKELGKLRELRILRCTIHISDEGMERDLLESLANLHKIRTLCILGSALPSGITREACFVTPQRLGQLCLECFKFSGLPVWINSSLLLNLTHLDVSVHVVQEQDMETLGRLPELCYLKLNSDYTRLVSIRNGDLQRYLFRKLRFFVSPFLFARFDDSHGRENDGGICIAVAPSIMMPSLESLVFCVYVRFLKDMVEMQPGFDNLHMQLGFEKVASSSLQRVTATIQCEDATAAEVEEAKTALAHAADLHPNRPTLTTQMVNKHKMLSSDRELRV
ncbi:disease resistance protein PIK6-NP-like [Oryza glaberrima]|uniref:disease resistance protein PIK6-NP-like n=1 Tax=Oryza glaberrima TaxID=4538 RepID=UPI00224C3E65|nr:disease resistance protein PIK6-NP-like [Oryza glaberrima]